MRGLGSSQGVPSVGRILQIGGSTRTDGQAPTVAVTAPAGGATVSGTNVTVSASATDDVGVTGVQFTLDGANLGASVTTAPYTMTWDSTTVANGTDRKSTRLNSSHRCISYAVFCLKKKKIFNNDC